MDKSLRKSLDKSMAMTIRSRNSEYSEIMTTRSFADNQEIKYHRHGSPEVMRLHFLPAMMAIQFNSFARQRFRISGDTLSLQCPI